MVAIGKHFCGRYDQEEEKEEVLPEWPAEVEAGDIEQPDRATQGHSYMKYAMRERDWVAPLLQNYGRLK